MVGMEVNDYSIYREYLLGEGPSSLFTPSILCQNSYWDFKKKHSKSLLRIALTHSVYSREHGYKPLALMAAS
jgi:hypothetical protein